MKTVSSRVVANEIEMGELGKEIGRALKPRDIIFLNGELGAGKTTLVKGIAEGLGIDQTVTSPTYTVVKEYDGRLCHVDAYRLDDLDNLGIDYYIDKDYIICIEWGGNIMEALEDIPYQIIDIDYRGDGRVVTIEEVNE